MNKVQESGALVSISIAVTILSKLNVIGQIGLLCL